MCGLIGVFPSVGVSGIQSATNCLAHRGPDDSGVFDDGSVGLGHRRLAIQDLSPNGHQPMQAQGENVWIVFNGEIYNHFEIRRKLPKQTNYRSSSDTETLLQAYLQLGLDSLPLLNGIFAFAIYDQRKHCLLIARDQFGVKPLYYHYQNQQLAFASELKALLACREFDRELDGRALVNYVNFLWSPGQATPFKQVMKLEPGHYFTFDTHNPPDTIQPIKFYEIPYTGVTSSDSEAQLIDALDAKLNSAVERQLLADVPVGFFLSGGLDSSLIAAIARNKIGGPFRAYTIRANTDAQVEGFADDLKYAQQVARYIDVDLQIVDGQSDIVRDFDSMIWHLDEPQADPAPLHVRNICRIAREMGDVVLLGGTAGDDLFSGYRRHQALRIEGLLQRLPRGFAKLLGSLATHLPAKLPWARRLQKIGKQLGKSTLQRMAGYYSWVDLDINKSLFSETIQAEIKDHDPLKLLMDSLAAIPHEHELLNLMLFWDTKFFLTDHNLNYTDKMSMAEGVEVRVPFLDVELVDFACRLPVHCKLRGSTTKYLLKKVAERYLPKDVIYRPKTGFGAPVRQWIQDGRFNQRLQEVLSKADSSHSVFSRKGIQQLIEGNEKGRLDGAYTIWSVMAIDSWTKQFAFARS